jgi:hypothetical protein
VEEGEEAEEEGEEEEGEEAEVCVTLIKREIGWRVPKCVKQVTGNPITTNILFLLQPQAVNGLKCNVMKDDYTNNNKLQ